MSSHSDQASFDQLIQARYGNPSLQLSQKLSQFHPVLDSIIGHRSIRAYLSDPLPAGTLDLLLAAAQSAPTSSNLQAWSLIAVEDKARKARLASLCRDQQHIHEAPTFLIWLADLSRLRRIAQSQAAPSAGLDYFESFVLAVIDAALAAQNAVVAAESLGLGTVYIGALRNEPDKVAAELELPPEILPIFGLVVGHPDPNRPPAEIKPRLSAGAILHRETYCLELERQALADYDVTLKEFQASQNLPTQGWTQQVLQRVGTAEALGGRVQLLEIVRKLGFQLK